MRLISLGVKNFKSIRDGIEISGLGTSNAIIGPNNEGKSSILEALYLARCLVQAERNNDDSTNYIRERLPDKNIDNRLEVRATFEINSALGQSEETQAKGTELSLVYVALGWGGQIPGGDPTRFYPTEVKVVYPDKFESTVVSPLLDTEGPDNFEVRDYSLTDLRRHDLGSRAIRCDQMSEIMRGGHEDGVLHLLGNWARGLIYVSSVREIQTRGDLNVDVSLINGESLPAMLHKMHSNQPGRFNEFEKLITGLVPMIKKVHAPLEGSGEVSIRVSMGEVSDTDQAYRLDTVGKGITEIFYLAAMIWFSPDGSTLLIEEPERGLHPSSQRLLERHARAHAQQSSKQLFWATHSTIMASSTIEGSVHLVTLPSDQGTVAINITQKNAHTLRTSIGQTNLDVYTADVGVFFDGESEGAALPPIIEYLLSPQEFRSIRFNPLNGDIRSRRELLSYLSTLLIGNHASIFVFADDENEAQRTREDLLRSIKGLQGGGRAFIHIWDCGAKGKTGETRGAEFEDNFSYDELVIAANELGGGQSLTPTKLESRANKVPRKMISKVLESYYHGEGYEGWSKIKLGALLGHNAIAKIESNEPRGYGGAGYEFERIITENLRSLLPNY